jgi:hypothetical protein
MLQIVRAKARTKLRPECPYDIYLLCNGSASNSYARYERAFAFTSYAP